MKYVSIIMVAAAFLLGTTVLQAADYVPGELIVKFEHDILEMKEVDNTPVTQVNIKNLELAQALQGYGVYSVEKICKTPEAQAGLTYIDVSQVFLIRMRSDLDVKSVAKELEKIPGVIYAEPNHILQFCAQMPPPIDYNFDAPGEEQWGLENPYYPGKDINALEAWSIQKGNRSVKLAILDSGIEEAHSGPSGDEFSGRIPQDGKEVFCETEANPPINDLVGHGTHVAGIAAANTNDQVYGEGGFHGVAGVAGGWSNQGGVSLLIGKVGDFQGYEDDVIEGIIWAIEKRADVINLSCGTDECDPTNPGAYEYFQTFTDAILNAFASGATVFIASGNRGYPVKEGLDYPAWMSKWDICCTVGAMIQNGERWGSSSFGDGLSFVAPGENIWSTWNAAKGYYSCESGTSMASPMAAGVGALLYSEALEKGFTPNPMTGKSLWDVDCKRIMEYSAQDLVYSRFVGDPNWEEMAGEGRDIYTGYGCVDAYAALKRLDEPYTLTRHEVIPTQGIQVGRDVEVVFARPPKPGMSKGKYLCDVYCWSGNVYPTLEDSWIWGNPTQGTTGYGNDNPNPAIPYVGGGQGPQNGVHAQGLGVLLSTYTYKIKAWWNEYIGQWAYLDPPGSYIWAPRAPGELVIVYTENGIDPTLISSSEVKEDKGVFEPELNVVGEVLSNTFTVNYSLPATAKTSIAVYDVTGREVTTLLTGKQSAGAHELVWEGLDDAGRSVSTGVYFIRMQAGDFHANEKITLIR